MPDEITGGLGGSLTEEKPSKMPTKDLWGLMGAITQAKIAASNFTSSLRLSPRS